MPTRIKAAKATLNKYEAEQVREIAAWKSLPPNLLSELWNTLALQPAKVVAMVIPDAIVRGAIELAYDASEVLAGRESIKRQAGVRDIVELRKKPLEECDRLAKQAGMTAQALAVAEGAATGAGGVLTTLLDVPILFVLGLRTILRISYCYGFPVETPKDRYFNLGVLTAATSGSLPTRRQRLGQLRDLENLLVEEIQVETVTQELLSILFQLELFEEVPGLGAASGALINLAFMRRLDVTARRIFQERWLVANGKTREITPAEAPAHHLAPGLAGLLGRTAYSGCYRLSFGLSLPVYTVAALLRSPAASLKADMKNSLPSPAALSGRASATARSTRARSAGSLLAPA
jgi:EcsC protein family